MGDDRSEKVEHGAEATDVARSSKREVYACEECGTEVGKGTEACPDCGGAIERVHPYFVSMDAYASALLSLRRREDGVDVGSLIERCLAVWRSEVANREFPDDFHITRWVEDDVEGNGDCWTVGYHCEGDRNAHGRSMAAALQNWLEVWGP